MGETVTVKFVNNKTEYGSAIRLYYSKTKRTKIDIVLDLGLIVFGIVCWIKYSFSWVWVFLLTAGCLCLVLMYFVYYITPSIRFNHEPKFRDEYTLTFSDDGLEFMTDHLSSKLDWEYYFKAWESDRLYLLFYGKSLFTIIPKRAFDDEDQENRFRSIISKNLREGIKRV